MSSAAPSKIDRPSPRGAFAAFWSSTAVSSIGDGAYVAAAPLLAAALTTDPVAVAVVGAASSAPWFLVGFWSGAVVDRVSRRATVVISDLVRAAALAVLAVSVVSGAATIALLAATSFAITAGKCFADAASQAMLPAVVGRDAHVLSGANGRLYATDTVGRSLLGPPIGGFTFSLAPWAPFVVDSVSFAGSAALLAALPPAPAPRGDGQRIWMAVREGFAYLFHDRALLGLTATMTVFNVAYNMAAATLVLFAKLELNLSDVGFGLLLATGAAGAVLAGWTSAPLARRFSVNTVLWIGVVAQAAAWPAFVVVESPVVAGLVFAILGAASTYVTTAVVSARQMRVPDRLLGRVVSAFRLFGNGASPIGAMLGGVIASVYGLRAPFAAAALLLTSFVVVVALASVLTRRR